MIDHVIWAVGNLGDLLILSVLFTRRHYPRLPWFTLLVAFHFLSAVGGKIASHISGHEVSGLAAIIIACMDLALQTAVFAEFTWIALMPVARLRRVILRLLLVAGGLLIVLRFAPAAYHSLPEVLVLVRSLLTILKLEWAIVLVILLAPLRLSWRSHVAAISFGYGVFSAVQLAADGYFGTSSAISNCVSAPFFRISVYLLVLSWMLFALWLAEPVFRGETTIAEGLVELSRR
jgi:hypothetical protein